MKRTILIVDDSESVREMLTYSLEDAGYNILAGTDGEDALKYFADNRKIHLVITDLHMPRLDGIGFIKKVRFLDNYRYVPILFLTTESQGSKKEEAKKAGATGWLVKPFVADKLLTIIKKVLR
jgi:two-component system, chemotaxis family, chemotaxis protein CheY